MRNKVRKIRVNLNHRFLTVDYALQQGKKTSAVEIPFSMLSVDVKEGTLDPATKGLFKTKKFHDVGVLEKIVGGDPQELIKKGLFLRVNQIRVPFENDEAVGCFEFLRFLGDNANSLDDLYRDERTEAEIEED